MSSKEDLTDGGRLCRVCGLPVYHCPAANGAPEDCNPPLRKCWKCGALDAPYDWQFIPSSEHKPMCEVCYAEASKRMEEDLARGIVY